MWRGGKRVIVKMWKSGRHTDTQKEGEQMEQAISLKCDHNDFFRLFISNRYFHFFLSNSLQSRILLWFSTFYFFHLFIFLQKANLGWKKQWVAWSSRNQHLLLHTLWTLKQHGKVHSNISYSRWEVRWPNYLNKADLIWFDSILSDLIWYDLN